MMAFPSAAESVSQKEAKRIAVKFFNAAHGQVMADPVYIYNGKRLTTDRLFSPFYVFNHPAGGFVVISAENKAYPILGYSLTDNFNPEETGDVTRNLLRMYASHIENVRYDSSIPYEAIDAWTDIPGHIASVLAAEYDATDPVISREDAMVELAYVASTPDAEASTSAFHNPLQWKEMIDMELAEKRTVPIALIGEDEIFPVLLHGRKGDFYRMNLDGANRQLWRLLPTEIISQGEMAVFGNPPVIPEEIYEEKPFTFYNDFLALTRSEQEQQQAAIENSMIVTEPVVRWHGSGHFTVVLPEDALSLRVYNLAGQEVCSEKYRETNQAHIDLTQLPTGFYFAVVFGESGKPFGIKLFR